MELPDELTAVNNILSLFPLDYSYKLEDGKVLIKEITDRESCKVSPHF